MGEEGEKIELSALFQKKKDVAPLQVCSLNISVWYLNELAAWRMIEVVGKKKTTINTIYKLRSLCVCVFVFGFCVAGGGKNDVLICNPKKKINLKKQEQNLSQLPTSVSRLRALKYEQQEDNKDKEEEDLTSDQLSTFHEFEIEFRRTIDGADDGDASVPTIGVLEDIYFVPDLPNIVNRKITNCSTTMKFDGFFTQKKHNTYTCTVAFKKKCSSQNLNDLNKTKKKKTKSLCSATMMTLTERMIM